MAKTAPRRGASGIETPSAGYSGTPLPKKLGMVEGKRCALVDAPKGFERVLGDLPEGASITRSSRESGLDVAIVFVVSRSRLVDAFLETARRMVPSGGIWIAWPKKTSGVTTDVTEDVLREELLPTGFVDNKVAAIDATWSGLRFVLRRENRAAEKDHFSGEKRRSKS